MEGSFHNDFDFCHNCPAVLCHEDVSPKVSVCFESNREQILSLTLLFFVEDNFLQSVGAVFLLTVMYPCGLKHDNNQTL